MRVYLHWVNYSKLFRFDSCVLAYLAPHLIFSYDIAPSPVIMEESSVCAFRNIVSINNFRFYL